MITLPDFITTAPANCARPGEIDPELWHSDNPDDRRTAINICQACPLYNACDGYGTTYNLTGIWGGRTRGQRNGTTTDTTVHPHAEEWIDHDGARRRPCGTRGAYMQHRRRAEYCDHCETAQAARIEAGRRQLLADAHAIGGSEQGYYTHRRLGETPCSLCKGAMRRASAERKAQRASEAGAWAAYEPAA